MLLINSTYGRAFKAIRDDEVAAEAMGINLAQHKMLAFCHQLVLRRRRRRACWPCIMSTVQASAVHHPRMTYEILLIVVIGGIGSITGSRAGDRSCTSPAPSGGCASWTPATYPRHVQAPLLRNGFRMVVFSVVIMIVVLFFRKGIMGDRELHRTYLPAASSRHKEGRRRRSK